MVPVTIITLRTAMLPALIRRFHEASGSAIVLLGKRFAIEEFLHVDDLAEACVLVLENGILMLMKAF